MIRTIIKYKDNKILLDDSEVFQTYEKMQPGIYDIEFDEYNRFKNFLEINIPKVYPLMPSDELSNIQDYINIFLSKKYEDFCKQTNIHRKTGILLHGLPGIGKSNYFNDVINKAIKHNNAIVFNINNPLKLSRIGEQLKKIRLIQDDLIIVLLEEIEEMFSQSGSESTLKNLMDGIDSINNIIFLASTNYIEIIPKTLKERPSRFKKVLSIEQSKNTDEVKKWLVDTFKIFDPEISIDECDKLYSKCINKSIDEIKHVLVDYKMGINSKSNKKKIGFKSW